MTRKFTLNYLYYLKYITTKKYLFKMSQLLTKLIEEDKYGRTALMIALIYRCTDQANALINAGTDLNVRDKDGRTALMIALIHSQSNVDILIEAGANVNAKDNKGNNAIYYAVNNNNSTEIIEKIKELNSSFNLFLIIFGLTGEGLNLIYQIDSFVDVIEEIRNFI